MILAGRKLLVIRGEREGKKKRWRTGQALESFVEFLDGRRFDVADIGHEVCDLVEGRECEFHHGTQRGRGTYVAAAVGHLLVDVVVAQNFVDWV